MCISDYCEYNYAITDSNVYHSRQVGLYIAFYRNNASGQIKVTHIDSHDGSSGIQYKNITGKTWQLSDIL